MGDAVALTYFVRVCCVGRWCARFNIKTGNSSRECLAAAVRWVREALVSFAPPELNRTHHSLLVPS
jgi:hypothetical protein